MYAPDRAYDKTVASGWKLQKTCDGNVFSKSVRQEEDVIDPVLQKYYRTLERGLMKPKTLKLDKRSSSTNPAGRNLLIQSVRNQESYKATNPKKWNPPNFLPELINREEMPMYEG